MSALESLKSDFNNKTAPAIAPFTGFLEFQDDEPPAALLNIAPSGERADSVIAEDSIDIARDALLREARLLREKAFLLEKDFQAKAAEWVYELITAIAPMLPPLIAKTTILHLLAHQEASKGDAAIIIAAGRRLYDDLAESFQNASEARFILDDSLEENSLVAEWRYGGVSISPSAAIAEILKITGDLLETER